MAGMPQRRSSEDVLVTAFFPLPKRWVFLLKMIGNDLWDKGAFSPFVLPWCTTPSVPFFVSQPFPEFPGEAPLRARGLGMSEAAPTAVARSRHQRRNLAEVQLGPDIRPAPDLQYCLELLKR